MSYKWLLSLSAFAVINLFSVNNHKLEVRPTLFLNATLFYWENHETGKHKVDELREAAEADKQLRKQFQKERERIAERFNVHKAKNEMDREKQKAYTVAMEEISKRENESICKFCKTRDRIGKRVQELSEEYAKTMWACAVIDYIPGYCGRLYIDPAYDITERILEQLNKEYSKQK